MKKLLFASILAIFAVSSIRAMDVTFEQPSYPVGTDKIKATIKPGKNEKVTGVSVSPAGAADKVEVKNNDVTVDVKDDFKGTIVITVKYAVFDKDGSEKEYDLVATDYTEIGGECTYCHGWAEPTDNKIDIDTPNDTEYYEINLVPAADKTLDDVLGGDQLLADLRKRLSDKQKERDDLIPGYNDLLDKSNKAETELNAAKKAWEDLNAEYVALYEKLKELDEQLKSGEGDAAAIRKAMKDIRAQMKELRPKVKAAYDAYAAAQTAYNAAYEAFCKAENELKSIEKEIASLEKAIEELEKEKEKEEKEGDKGEAGKPNGSHQGSPADYYYFTKNETKSGLKCTACGKPKVMFRFIETFKDIDVKPLRSLIIMPKWNQVGDAGPKTQAAWTKFTAALLVHEQGHRSIYDAKYRQPAVALLQHFFCLRFIGEVHIPNGGSRQDAVDKARDAQNKKFAQLQAGLAKLAAAENDAQDKYEDKTDHGRTQSDYDEKAENTVYPDIPLNT